MKRFLIFVLSVMLTVGCLACAAGCDFSLPDGGNAAAGGGNAETEEGSDVTKGKNIAIAEGAVATVEYHEGLGYSVDIKGALKNTGKRNYTYVSISFTLYDESGANIGQALANMNNLAAGETWKYKATSMGFFDEKPVKWKYAEITCF